MPASHFQQAVRAFVRVLLTLARVYNLALVVNRDTPENELLKAYKQIGGGAGGCKTREREA